LAFARVRMQKVTEYQEIAAEQVFFVSDTHFKGPDAPGEAGRRERFISFLEGIPPRSVLLLLGDIFDFYFECRTTIPKRYFDICYALSECGRRGVGFHFLGGNHDYWTRDFFSRHLGITVHKRVIHLACQGRKLICVHGDLTPRGDIGYKILRAVIQNRIVIAAAGLLHPDAMESIASFVSKVSKSQQRGSHESAARALGATAFRRFFNEDNDAFIMGHIHFPLHTRQDGNDFLILGGWFEKYTYGKLSNGKITLEEFTG
jgi:UDP-2,3-diacylglucosamine hydrolase